jgi:carbamoyltransferase
MADYFARYADPSEVVTYSGGTAQNTVVNTSLRNRFPHLQIPPHCPDDGLSFGCVEFLRQHFQQEPFDTSGFPYWQSDIAPTSTPSAQTIEKTAELLAQGKIVGWYQGQGEVGPRALGNRSILMDPTLAGGKDLINAKVKHREPYRPFGASVLLEHTHKIFYCDYESPYMLYVIDCRDRERYASIVHVDGSCRIQTVNEDPQYAVYRDVIEAFRRKTGVPMLLNTSLNVDGKPIAGSPDDALTLLKSSEMDAVVIGDEMYVK